MPCWPYTGFTSQSCSYIYILFQHIHVVLSLGVARRGSGVCVCSLRKVYLYVYIINICVFTMHEKNPYYLRRMHVLVAIHEKSFVNPDHIAPPHFFWLR
jgi:hypothetical protein